MLKVGCKAVDFTGASDLANKFVRSGMRVVQAMAVLEELEETARLGSLIFISIE